VALGALVGPVGPAGPVRQAALVGVAVAVRMLRSLSFLLAVAAQAGPAILRQLGPVELAAV